MEIALAFWLRDPNDSTPARPYGFTYRLRPGWTC